MEYLGLSLFALAALGGAYLITRLMGRTERNTGSTHGGGASEAMYY